MASENVATVILPKARDDLIQTRSRVEMTIRDMCSPPLLYLTHKALSRKDQSAKGASTVYN